MHRKLILKTFLSPGDICTLTACIESLHATYPNQYLTDVRTSCDELFRHNPRLSRLDAVEAETLEMHYTDLVQRSSTVPNAFLRGFCYDLGRQLGIPLELTTNRPHLYVSETEAFSHPLLSYTEDPLSPYWLVNAGTKRDFTLKQWPVEYYQQVIDNFSGRIRFVQIGSDDDNHPPLDGVINLLGKTSIRSLVHLAYHAAGGLGPVTLLQHLCAAFEKPYVALLGGREPIAWTQYPLQTTLHTLGMLECCKTRACWRSRVVPLGDGSKNDQNLCDAPILKFQRPVGKCMTLITPEDVTRVIQRIHGSDVTRVAPASLPGPDKLHFDVHTPSQNPESLSLVAHSAWGFETKIIPAPADRKWMDETKDRFAYHCLPMVIANQSGWFVLAPCDVVAEWNGGSAPEDLKIRTNPDSQEALARSSVGNGILTWIIPYVFRTSAGWNLLCRGPANFGKDGIYPLEGLVETDWAVASFSMNWKFTRPGACRFDAGEAVAMLVPQRRFELESFRPRFARLNENPALFQGYSRWAQARTEFLADRMRGDPCAVNRQFQKHYFHGCTNTGGSFFPDHQTSRNLAMFREVDARGEALSRSTTQSSGAGTCRGLEVTAGTTSDVGSTRPPRSFVAKPFLDNSFAYTSPYGGCWLENYYRKGAADLFAKKITTEASFRSCLNSADRYPALVIMGNFIADRHGIQSICRELGIDWICSEDGFFPHYTTLHADPLGFSWESSLSRMVFRHLSPKQRLVAQEHRERWLNFERQQVPEVIRQRYVLWPLQLIGDRVNRWDLNVPAWSGLIAHFRKCLPSEFQLVLKPHPRGKASDSFLKSIAGIPNTVILREACHLPSLIEGASAVAGANSTVLLEARLMFRKPTYSYARGWHSNHTHLFLPVYRSQKPRDLPRMEYLDSAHLGDEWVEDYADWFLYQLLVRQLDRHEAADFDKLRQWIMRRTYRAFKQYGEDLFA